MQRVAKQRTEPQGSRALALRRSMRASGPRAIARDLTTGKDFKWTGVDKPTESGNPGASTAPEK